MAQPNSKTKDSTSKTVIARTVLDRFFSPTNIYRESDLGGKNLSLQTSVQRYLKGATDRPFLLPFRTSEQELTIWYACAHSETECRALRAELEAFIGPSFADFYSNGPEISVANSLVLPILETNGLCHFSFQAIGARAEERIGRQWQVYWALLDRRPVRAAIQPKTFAQLRALFDRALLAKNEPEAISAMGALRDQHGLSAENRAFLDIRLNAAFGRWSQIAEHQQLKHLVELRLPPETYGDVFEALYEVRLLPYEQTTDPTSLLEAYDDEVRPLLAPLLRSRGLSRRPVVLKTALLNELIQQKPNADLCCKLLDELGTGRFGTVEEGLRARVNELQPKIGLDEALEEISLERYEQACVLLDPLPDSVEVLTALLRCAREIEDPDLARSILDRLAKTENQVSLTIRGQSTRLIQAVEKIASPKPVADTWLGRLSFDATDDSSVANYLIRWREIARSTDARNALPEQGFAEALATLSEELTVAQPAVFEVIYPVWFEWLFEYTPPDSRFLVTYQALTESLRVRDRFGDTDLELLKMATLHIVHAGASAKEYGQAIDSLIAVFNQVRSPHTMAWALDLADGLAVAPCRNAEARLRWLTLAVQAGTEQYGRLGIAERSLLKLLARENSINLPTLESPTEVSPEARQLSVRVLLYSLDGPALSRATGLLKDMFPSAVFEINDDEVCTTRLKNSVRNADWVVFVAAVAKHQAFFCIKNALRNDSSLLHVVGSGTTRIVERVIHQSQAYEDVATH